MQTDKWKEFFSLVSRVLGKGHFDIEVSESWCSWTTFERLKNDDAGYWQAGIPAQPDIGDKNIKDGSVWGQPFWFDDIAHIIIPKKFVTDMGVAKKQDIETLAKKLQVNSIEHSINEYLLEIKLY